MKRFVSHFARKMSEKQETNSTLVMLFFLLLHFSSCSSTNTFTVNHFILSQFILFSSLFALWTFSAWKHFQFKVNVHFQVSLNNFRKQKSLSSQTLKNCYSSCVCISKHWKWFDLKTNHFTWSSISIEISIRKITRKWRNKKSDKYQKHLLRKIFLSKN